MLAAVALLTMLGLAAPALGMDVEERADVYIAALERWGLDRVCVVVDPKTCSGGTMDIDSLTQQTPLFLSSVSGTVLDLKALTWTVCTTVHTAPLTEEYKRECAKNEINPFAKQLFFAMLVVSILLLSMGDRWIDGGDRMSCIAAYWLSDLAAGLVCATLVEYVQPTVPSWYKLYQIVVLELVIFDAPHMVLKLCNVDSCTWKISCIVFGFVYAGFAIVYAYQTSSIAIVGHHPLVLGFVAFLLDFPKEMLKNWVMRCGSNEGYTFLLSDLEHPLPECCRPLKVKAEKVATKLEGLL